MATMTGDESQAFLSRWGGFPVVPVALALLLCVAIKAWSYLASYANDHGAKSIGLLSWAWDSWLGGLFSMGDGVILEGEALYDGDGFGGSSESVDRVGSGEDWLYSSSQQAGEQREGTSGSSASADAADTEDGLWLSRPLKERLALFVGTWRVGENARLADPLPSLDWMPVGYKHDLYVVGLQSSAKELDPSSHIPRVNQDNVWFEQIEKMVDSEGVNFFRVITISFLSLHLLILARKEHRRRTSEITFSVYPSIENALQMLKDSMPRAIGITFNLGDTSMCFLHTFLPREEWQWSPSCSPSISPTCSPSRSPSSRRNSTADRESWDREKAKEADADQESDVRRIGERRGSRSGPGGRRYSNAQQMQQQHAEKFKSLLATMRIKHQDREVVGSYDYLFVLGNATMGSGNSTLFAEDGIRLPLIEPCGHNTKQIWDARVLYSCLPGCPLENIEYSSSFNAGLYPPVSSLFSVEYLVTQDSTKKDKYAELVFTSLQVKGLSQQDSRGLANPYVAFSAPYIESGVPSTPVAYKTVDPVWKKHEIPVIRTYVAGREWLRYLQVAVYSRNVSLEDELMGQGVVPLQALNGYSSTPFCIPLILHGEVRGAMAGCVNVTYNPPMRPLSSRML